jgi:hypothetical protein
LAKVVAGFGSVRPLVEDIHADSDLNRPEEPATMKSDTTEIEKVSD